MAYILIVPFRFPFFLPLIPCANKEKNVINEVTSSAWERFQSTDKDNLKIIGDLI